MVLAASSYGTGQINQAASVRQESPVDEALRRLDESMGAVDMALSELSSRLNPVSREQCPQEAGKGMDRPASEYPVAADIHRGADLANAFAERIRDMTDRLGV